MRKLLFAVAFLVPFGFWAYPKAHTAYKAYEGAAYVDCQSYLKKCLGDYASKLMAKLAYSREDAQDIFTRAVLKMFDERHHLTLTRLLLTGT